MPGSAEDAQKRARALGLTGAKGTLAPTDPMRLAAACLLTPASALALFLSLQTPWAILLAAPCLTALAVTAPAMARYFIAFSPRNAFPRNLPAFARWAALYSGAMLIMIALPPGLSPNAKAATWLALAKCMLLLPLIKALIRARRVWK
ncbi:MAG: hypothetical protein AAGF13_06525 [Pseudomonadota bacterium]